MSVPENTPIVSKAAVIILAAGSSSRLGSPKQLLTVDDKTLLQHTIEAAKAAGIDPVIVVLGANRELIKKDLNAKEVVIAENEKWQSGLASSIHSGIEALTKVSPSADAAILMVCDQPFVSAELLNDLLRKQKETGKAIVASSYDNTLGTPALFHSSLFPELAALEGDTGAKILLKKYENQLSSVPFIRGGIDIDTGEDYKNLGK